MGSLSKVEEGRVNRFAEQVARQCGFRFVPPMQLRRGGGAAWYPQRGVIRMGVDELATREDRLFYLCAHELAHANGPPSETHSLAFWRRLAHGLKRGGRLELFHYGYLYKEGAVAVARELGLADAPQIEEFAFTPGDAVEDRNGRHWVVTGRFRRAGEAHYRLERPGWWWRTSEVNLLEAAR